MFLYRLALSLGKTVAELSTLPSDELTTWQAFYQLEPFGPWRTDLNAAYICSVFASCHGAKNAQPSKYMPDFTPKEKDTPETLKRKMLDWAKQVNR